MENNNAKQAQLDRAFKKEKKSIFGFFIQNYRVTYLLIIAILFLGIFSLVSLPRESEPEVNIPYAVVTTVYPGASPADIEELVTNKVEEKVKNVENLKEYSSGSKQGISSVFVEFEAEADLQTSFQKLRDTVDEARTNLPDDCEDPMVTEIRVDDFAIVAYSLVSQSLDKVELKKYADLIKDKLEGISGVSKVEEIGGVEREFQIIVDQAKLSNYNISLAQIGNAVSRANFNLPAGDIEIDGFKYNVTVKGRFEKFENLEEVVITTYENSPVYLGDVAQVSDGFKEQKTESSIGFSEQDASTTISLAVYKKTGGNIIDIVDSANSEIEKMETSGELPGDLRIEKTSDNAWYIRDSLSTLGTSGLQTMILIVLLLFLVLGIRGSIITGLSVPIAFLTSFIYLKASGQTLNSIVLFSLVISLGLMVDNSIIIMEGIVEYMTTYKKTALEAAILAVWNYKWAIISGTMTTVAAFFPMLLVSGIMGEYFSYIPKTITATLLSSLFVALIIIPTLAARFVKIKPEGSNEKKSAKRYFVIHHKIEKLKIKYEKLMRRILKSKKIRRCVLGVSWSLFIIAVIVPVSGLMKVEMFPTVDANEFLVTVELPVGSNLENTGEVVSEVEKVIQQISEMKSYVTNVGVLNSWHGTGSSAAHFATISVNLVDSKERKIKSFGIVEKYRDELESISGAEIQVEHMASGPPSGSPIEVRIYGKDLIVLSGIASECEEILKSIDGTTNVSNSLQESTGEFTFTIDKQKANYYGVDSATIAMTLRNAIYGSTVSAVTIDGDDIDINMKYHEGKLDDASDLGNVLISTPSGQTVYLDQLADLTLEPSLVSIGHLDGDRLVTVNSLLNADANLQKIIAEFETRKESVDLPQGYTIKIGGENEDIDKSFQEVFLSMIIAIILIAFILILQFNSFRQPFIILTALPLAIIGVVLGLNITGQAFSFPAFLGIVSLAGIAVNDAIVLIDRINKNMEVGMDKIDGIIEGGTARMQPIFLTSLTTIAGIVPLLFSDEMWIGFSVTLIFGLIFSTCLTLIIVPILYYNITKKDRF